MSAAPQSGMIGYAETGQTHLSLPGRLSKKYIGMVRE